MFASFNRPGWRGGAVNMGNAMRALALFSIFALYACSNPVADAEKRYEIVKKNGRADDICAQGRAVSQAYLEAKDEEGYNQRKVATDIECSYARLQESDGIYRIDGKDVKIDADNILGN